MLSRFLLVLAVVVLVLAFLMVGLTAADLEAAQVAGSV
jgi:cell division protein FtsL